MYTSRLRAFDENLQRFKIDISLYAKWESYLVQVLVGSFRASLFYDLYITSVESGIFLISVDIGRPRAKVKDSVDYRSALFLLRAYGHSLRLSLIKVQFIK